MIDEKVKVSDEDAFRTTRELAKTEGILVGGSSGGVVYVALQKARELPFDKNIVAILPDHGDRYLTTIFSDDWLKEKGVSLD